MKKALLSICALSAVACGAYGITAVPQVHAAGLTCSQLAQAQEDIGAATSVDRVVEIMKGLGAGPQTLESMAVDTLAANKKVALDEIADAQTFDGKCKS